MSTDITIEELESHIENMIENVEIDIAKVIIFGSTARGERTSESDTDLIIISDEYPESQIYERVSRFYQEWDSKNYGPVEFLCLTTKEWNKKKKKTHSVYEKAEEEGIVLNY